MISNKLIVGIKLEINIISGIKDYEGQTYISQLLDVLNDQEYIIADPLHELKIIFIPLGAKIKISFIHEANERNEVLCFFATVVQKYEKDNIYSLQIIRETNFDKIQRRKHFRLDCNLNIYYRKHIDSNLQNGEKDENSFKKALTKNISAGGACIITDEIIEKDALVEALFQLNDNTSVSTLSKVVRCSQIGYQEIPKNIFGFYIVEISQKDQDQIFKYIFEKERYLLKYKK